MIKVFRRVREIQVLTEKSIGKFISNIDEMKTGIRTVKMTGQEQNEGERIETSAKSIESNTFKLMRTHALTPPVIDLSSAFVYMLVVGGGGYMALSDQFDMDGASIIAFLIGLVIVFDPARNVAQFFTRLQSSLILLDSVHSILDIKTEQLTTGKAFKKTNDSKRASSANITSYKFSRIGINLPSSLRMKKSDVKIVYKALHKILKFK